MKNRTEWSRREPGESGNHDRAVRFDVTNGFIGITAFADEHSPSVDGRVLLSPRQFKSLLAFLSGTKRKRGFSQGMGA